MKTKIPLVMFLIFNLHCSNKSNYLIKYKKGSIQNKYNNNSRNSFYISKEFRKNNKQLSFYFPFKDSISVYLNDSLIHSKMNLETSRASFNVFVNFKVNPQNINFLTIVLNNRKEYLRIRVKNKFVFLNVQYIKNVDSKNWNLIYSNNIPGG